jgi:xylulokinase
MKQALFAGLDVSTQSCKLVIINLEKKVIYIDSINYDTDLPHYHTQNGVIQGLGEGVSESDPNMWIEAVETLFERLKNSDVPQNKIMEISVSGQQHGLVALDEAGNLTRSHSKLWNDFSTLEECGLLTDAVGGKDQMIKEVANSQRTGYTASKILQIARHEPDVFAQTNTFFLVHNYVNWYLTGGKNEGKRVMEPGDTSGMALWNTATGLWSDKLLEFISPDLADKFPPIFPSQRSIGEISKEVAQKFDFSPKCKIDAGSGDNMYSAIGTGNISAGIVTISLGTSGTIYSFLESVFIDPSGEIAAFRDSTGYYLALLCVSNMANGYNEILKQFKMSHEDFNEIIKQTPPGNAGRILIPWYMGERTPDVPLAAPLYFGFGLQDFTKEILCRAVLEGHVLNLYDGFRRMPTKAQEIRLTGGLSHSPAWQQTIADIFNAETVPVEGEGAALGAALHAAWVWLRESGNNRPLRELIHPYIVLRENERRKPIPENVQIYSTLKDEYRALSSRIRGEATEADPFRLRFELVK